MASAARSARNLRWGAVATLLALPALAVAHEVRLSGGAGHEARSGQVLTRPLLFVGGARLFHAVARVVPLPRDSRELAGGRNESEPPLPEAPHVLHLRFSDGTPPDEGACALHSPPPFSCAPTNPGCREKLRRSVERLFSDFDLRVALSPPAEAHLTIEVSSANGGWCDEKYAKAFGGVAPVDCSLSGKWGRTGYVFSCDDVARCAVRVAQEAAHLLGLDHTDDPADVMYPRETDGRARFRNVDIATLSPRCGRSLQNSHRILTTRLGKRTKQ